MRAVKKSVLIAALLSACLISAGCSISDSSREKVADIDFTVVDEENLPQEIKDVIEEKKKEEFRVIFSAKENMYIAVGYGERSTSGYSIAVKDLYLTENAIRIDTNLIGPAKGETINEEPTYPYIVVMIENMDYPVVFD
ncbi:MAG: protease complex subunit PrcB family protein [Thermoflexaceae bacterium]|nr:protease complex subunit PrcB family protein [Thermoflexaceae bacterium]